VKERQAAILSASLNLPTSLVSIDEREKAKLLRLKKLLLVMNQIEELDKIQVSVFVS
jgi:hypothetical protein